MQCSLPDTEPVCSHAVFARPVLSVSGRILLSVGHMEEQSVTEASVES